MTDLQYGDSLELVGCVDYLVSEQLALLKLRVFIRQIYSLSDISKCSYSFMHIIRKNMFCFKYDLILDLK